MKIKNPLHHFRIPHIIWFFAGVVITVGFNWIVFKDPKRITAAGVSSLVGMSAFLLALWSAFKVNKWLDNKINDKGFRQTEKILEYIEGIPEILTPFLNSLADINQAMNAFGPVKPVEEDKKQIKEQTLKVNNYCDQLVMACNTLKYWDLKLSEKGSKILDDLVTTLRELSGHHQRMSKLSGSEEINQEIMKNTIDIQKLMNLLDELLKLNHRSIFKSTEEITSPSEKVN